MRLIDVNELIELAKKNKAVNAALADLKDIKDIVNDATIIEAEPVKHGEWTDKEGWLVECSNCGDYYDNLFFRMDENFNYCPNCGAKMEGKEKWK